jgi:hypothetical protein
LALPVAGFGWSPAPQSDEEIELAALQFVRKVSGYRQPSRANEAAFQTAVTESSAATTLLAQQFAIRLSA